MTTTDEANPFEGWCVLELMGHRRLGGYVREVEFAGSKMVRIDIPGDGDDGADSTPITQLYGGSAIYCLSPLSRYEVQAAKAIPARLTCSDCGAALVDGDCPSCDVPEEAYEPRDDDEWTA